MTPREEAHARRARGEISRARLRQILAVLDGKCSNCRKRKALPAQQRCKTCRVKGAARDRARNKVRRALRVSLGQQDDRKGPQIGHRKTCGNCGKRGHNRLHCPSASPRPVQRRTP